MMEVAQKAALRIKFAVDERDIQDVIKGAHGKLATTSLPNDSYPFTIESIVPAGTAHENANVFTIYGTADQKSDLWRPGMKGEARIDVEKRRLIWIWTHRFVEFIRLKLWI
jgi:hypothetical protein